MPPKKKGAGKKAEPVPELSEEEYQQNMELIEQLKEELDQEREKNHFHKMECSTIKDMWEVSESEIHELNAKIRNEELQMIVDKEQHLAELKLCKQKTKYLYRENHYAMVKMKEEDQTMDEQVEQKHKRVKQKIQKKAVAITMKPPNVERRPLFDKLSLEHEKDMVWIEEMLQEDLEELLVEKMTAFQQLRTSLNNMRQTKLNTLFYKWNSLLTFIKKGHSNTLGNQQKIVDIVKMDSEIFERYKKEHDDDRKREKMMAKELKSILLNNELLSKLMSAADEENVNLKKKLRNHPKYAQRYC